MKNMLRNTLNSPYFFWLLLALPSFGMLYGVYNGDNLKGLLHPTGEFAARFMILCLMITPLQMLFSSRAWPYWLMRRRRYIGVAAFGYAALHTLFYVVDLNSFSKVVEELLEAGIWTGWIAFLIFVPLAVTSNDWSIRTLRKSWKPLQRWVYPAAVLTLAHWLLVSHDPAAALIHFTPLAALEAYRIWKNNSKTQGHAGKMA
jgi:methionine sulfoxide reductase heme-binding subunit